jgi:hypothetical protein
LGIGRRMRLSCRTAGKKWGRRHMALCEITNMTSQLSPQKTQRALKQFMLRAFFENTKAIIW